MLVVVVDADEASRGRVEGIAQGLGHEAASFPDGASALEALRGGLEAEAAVIDWEAPEVDGLEFCLRLRRLPSSAEAFVALMVDEDRANLSDCLKAGASVLLRKPFPPEELRALLRMAGRVSHLRRRLAIDQVEYADQLDELNRSLHRLKEAERAAGQIQRFLLPREPPEVPGARVRWLFEPSDEVAGDMFDVARLDEKRVGFWLLDSPGRGAPAALLTASVARLLTPHPQSGGILKRRCNRPPYYEIASPGAVASELNGRFPELGSEGQFCSFLYGVVDMEAREMTFARAGRVGAALAAPGKPAKMLQGPEGPPIGAVEGAAFEETRLSLSACDQAVFFTDGLVEARSSLGEEFGHVRALRVLDAARERGVARVLRNLRDQAVAFAGGTASDDIVLVGFEMIGEVSAPQEVSTEPLARLT